MREAAQRLAPSADAVGKDFADEHPDHRALAESVRRDEDDQPSQQHRPVCAYDAVAGAFGDQPSFQRSVRPLDFEERKGRRTQAQDVADGADQHQLLASKVVDDGHSGHCEGEVGEPDNNRLPERIGRAVACHFEDVLGVVDQRVDPGELVECGDGHG